MAGLGPESANGVGKSFKFLNHHCLSSAQNKNIFSIFLPASNHCFSLLIARLSLPSVRAMKN
jgi:hypothetical protein